MISREVFDKVKKKEIRFYKTLLEIRTIINSRVIQNDQEKIKEIDLILKNQDF